MSPSKVKNELNPPSLQLSRTEHEAPASQGTHSAAHRSPSGGSLVGQACRISSLPPETCDSWAPAGLKVPMADGSLYGACAELQWKKNLRQVPWVLGQIDSVLADTLAPLGTDSSTIAQCG